ncbi:MAG: DUF11 domain-containing protein [Gammaproteobacteria bacterium]|nr:DUF11 domain-containing protein [Gammaproteobacteria bacterium]
MTTIKQTMLIRLALVATLFATSWTAHAAGTASNTTISNSATVTYSVGGVAQAGIDSSPTGNSIPGAGVPTTFVVDNKVDLTVARVGVAAVSVVPGQASVATEFTVTNTGNTTQDFGLAGANIASGQALFAGTDNVDVTIVGAFAESGATPGYQVTEDTAVYVDELAADTSATVYVVASIPATLVNNDFGIVSLVATAQSGGAVGVQGINMAETVGADDPAVVDVVFADGAGTDDAARDGAFSDRHAYVVASAVLTVTKTSAVVSDPFNGNTNPKAIPGAVVRYTIIVANAGPADAAGVTIVDAIPVNTTYVPGSINFGGVQTDAGGDDASDFNVTNAGAVTVVVGALAAGNSATITFDVTIN